MSFLYTPGMRGVGAVSGPGTPGSGPAWDDSWYGGGSMSAAGVSVSPEGILAIPAVYACVTNISEDIGKVPFQMFEDLGADKGSRRASELVTDELLHDQPNAYQTSLEFREMMTAVAAVRRFAIAEIVMGTGPALPGDLPEGTQFVPLHPDLVREQFVSTGRRYEYRDPKRNFEPRYLLPDEVLILRGKLGRSLVDLARDSFGYEQATERFQGLLFSRGAKLGGVVQHPKHFDNDNERNGFRSALNEYAMGGQRAGRALLLEDGMTWQSAAMTGRDAQMIDSLRWGLLQTCRWFRMQPSKVQDLSDSHYANVEQEAIDYVVDTLLSWAIRWEQAVRRDVIVDRARYYARLLLDGLLRGDTQTRYAAYALAIQWGWMTRDEVRTKENLNPMGGLAAELNLDVGHGQPVAVMPDGRKVLQLPARADAPATRAHLRLFASDAASRIVRREISTIAKATKAAGADEAVWRAGIDAAYAEHAEYVAAALHIPEHVARKYVAEQRAALLESGPAAMDTWDTDRVAHLADLALNQQEIAA